MSASQGKLSVVVVDPRGYTPPYDYSLCNALLEHGCEVLLASTELGQVEWKIDGHFPRWNNFYDRTGKSRNDGGAGIRTSIAQGFDHILGMRRFAAMLRTRRPDIIHFQWLPLAAIDQFYLAQMKAHAKLVLTAHNTTLFHGAVARWRALGYRSALKHFDAIIVHTDFSKRRVLAHGWTDESKIHVVPHGVLEYYPVLASEEPGAQSNANLLFFGNLHPYKGIDVLLRAFARLSPAQANARLTIAGRPQMNVEPLLQLSRELRIDDRIDWMLRPIAEKEVPSRAATAVVLPYREIDQSGVLMTAIAFGKAILATRVGGIPETIQDGVHGYLVAPEDAHGMSLAAERLLADTELRKTMEARVRDLAMGRLAWSSVASRTLDLYGRLVKMMVPSVALAQSQTTEPALN